MDDLEQHQKTQKLKLWLPFGRVEISGSDILYTVVLGILSGYLIWMLKEHDIKNSENLTAILDAQVATTYVLTLTQDERNKLQLAKPKAIRQMERKTNE